MMNLSLKKIQKAYKKNDYAFFDRELPYNVNVFAVRRDRIVPNTFNDSIFVVYRDYNRKWRIREYPCTTYPGMHYLLNPMVRAGTAILVPNQYRGAYKVGKHRGKYDTLVQRGGPVTVYRDNDRDFLPEPHDPKQTGYFGINIHHAGRYQTYVGKWSAGCVVFKMKADHEDFMRVINEAKKIFGNRFTFTLFQENEL